MKQLSIILILLTFSLAAFGQRGGQQYDKEKLEAARVAFITNRLELKPSQAEKFWPLFNQFQEDRSKLMEEMSAINRSASTESDDDKAKDLIKKRFDIQDKMLQRERRFMDEVQQAISPSQAVKLGSINREFTRQVYRMQQGRERGSGPRN